MTWNGSVSGTDPYIVQVLQGADELSGGMFGLVWLIIAFLLTYAANRSHPAPEAFAAASWTTLVVAILLRLLGALQDWYLGVVVVMAIASLVFMKRGG